MYIREILNNFGEFWGTLGSFGELFFGELQKVPQNSPKVPQKNYQILPMIVGIVFCSFRLFYIFTYLYVLCIAFLQNWAVNTTIFELHRAMINDDTGVEPNVMQKIR